MEANDLIGLGPEELSRYVWNRLRLETPIDPPLAGLYGEEPPEEFLIRAARDGSDAFRAKLTAILAENLDRIGQMHPDGVTLWGDRRTDEQLASLVFTAEALREPTLAPVLERLAVAWTRSMPSRVTPSQCHLLRVLGLLQQGDGLRDFWIGLWDEGPREIRAEILFGLARADVDAGLARLGELIDMGTEIDLPLALRGLIGPNGPGLDRVLEAAEDLNPAQRETLHDALIRADADAERLEVL